MSDQRPSRRRSALVPSVVALIAALVAGITLLLTQADDRTDADPAARITAPAQDSVPRGASESPDPLARLARRQPGDPLARGPVDAPVVMVAYSDFQCPFCGRFARTTEPALVKEYVERDLLRIEWRDFPYLGPESLTAAHAGRAAARQGKFWEYHHVMYADQPSPNSGKITWARLADVARRLDLDVSEFRKDTYSSEVAARVQRDFNEGQSIGVTGTPAFLVNGDPIMGAQPLHVFERVIENAAARAR